MGNWLNGSPQQQQPGQLTALAQQLGIDPALLGSLGGAQGPTRAQMLGQLGAAITNNNQYGRNAITGGLADFAMMQGRQGPQGDPMDRLGQIIELQSMLDARKATDAKSKAQEAWAKKIMDDPDASPELKAAVELATVSGFNNASNAITAAMKPKEPVSYEKAAIDPEGQALFAAGWDGFSKPTPEMAASARALLARESAASGGAAAAGPEVPPGVDPEAWTAYQKKRFEGINARAMGIENGLAGVNDRYGRLKALTGDLRAARQYIGPGAGPARAALQINIATGKASPQEQAAWTALGLAEKGRIAQSMRERISETGAILMPGSQTEAEGKKLLEIVPGPNDTEEKVVEFEQRLEAWHAKVMAQAGLVGKYRNDPLTLERVLMTGQDPNPPQEEGRIEVDNTGQKWRIFDGPPRTMERVE